MLLSDLSKARVSKLPIYLASRKDPFEDKVYNKIILTNLVKDEQYLEKIFKEFNIGIERKDELFKAIDSFFNAQSLNEYAVSMTKDLYDHMGLLDKKDMRNLKAFMKFYSEFHIDEYSSTELDNLKSNCNVGVIRDLAKAIFLNRSGSQVKDTTEFSWTLKTYYSPGHAKRDWEDNCRDNQQLKESALLDTDEHFIYYIRDFLKKMPTYNLYALCAVLQSYDEFLPMCILQFDVRDPSSCVKKFKAHKVDYKFEFRDTDFGYNVLNLEMSYKSNNACRRAYDIRLKGERPVGVTDKYIVSVLEAELPKSVTWNPLTQTRELYSIARKYDFGEVEIV